MSPAHAHHAQVVVLGAGLQGSCVALALAHRGRQVTVLEGAEAPMLGASRVNEGKIHLGFVYALDPTRSTPRRMLAGALSFSPLLDRWLGPQPWASMRSSQFAYCVMPDSLLSADALRDAYTDITDAIPDVRAAVHDEIGAEPAYVSRPLRGELARRRGDGDAPHVDGQPVETVFSTEEVAIDPNRLGDAVRDALVAHPLVDVRTDTEVVGATRTAGGFAVEVVGPDGRPATWAATAVVNCLWEDRLRVDATIGVRPTIESWTYRVKHRVLVRTRPLPRPVPAVTMVQGPYGDMVPWPDGRVNISWYPVCRTELRKVHTPVEQAIRRPPPPADVAPETLRAMQELFPALVGATVLGVDGGFIVAPGTSDIDDRESALHRRVNPAAHEHDGWWTIDTGKLTLAPLLAHQAARRIDAGLPAAIAAR